MEQYIVWLENSALGRRMVAKTHSRARQEYTCKADQAMVFQRFEDAKAFARNWCHRTRCHFSVQDVQTGKQRFEVKQCN